MKEFLATKRVQWLFNLSKAPWYGSIYERLIKSVKRCLRKTLRNARVTLEELYTILVEVECVLNNRPLTYQCNDEFDKQLTPSHLICGRRLESLPQEDLNVVSDESLSREDATNRHKYVSQVLDQWWQRWQHEYLDVVTVHEDAKKRGFWRLARVERLIQSKDGKVRGATVKVVTPKGNVSLINRPISKLFPVEIPDNELVGTCSTTEEQRIENTEESRPQHRPRRAAALDGLETPR